MAISAFLGCGSYTFGFNQKLAAHARFARSLENPAGFNRALRNINARIGGPEHFPYGVPEQREERVAIALGPGIAALSKNPTAGGSPPETMDPGEGWAVSPSQEEPDQSQSKPLYVIHVPSIISGAYERNGFQTAPTNSDLPVLISRVHSVPSKMSAFSATDQSTECSKPPKQMGRDPGCQQQSRVSFLVGPHTTEPRAEQNVATSVISIVHPFS